MMKKKPIWMLCLTFALFCSTAVISGIDDMEFNGLRVMSEERLERLTADLSRVNNPQNADALIELDGHEIPYDKAHNTFYVSQSLEDKEYAGTFSPTGDNCTIYLQYDDAFKEKRTAIAEGHAFTLWFVTEDSYTISNLIFTGLPTVCIRTGEEGLTEEYERGNIVVQNPDDGDVITMSIKESAVEVKTNYNSGTISFKLYKDMYDEERSLSLLGLGKCTSWKLYQIYRKDYSLSREIVAAYVWSSICRDGTLQRDMEYAEVIVDGEYRGLYYLSPKVGKGYLNLGEADRAYKCEEILEDGTKRYDVIGDEDTHKNRSALEQFESLWEENNRDFTQTDTDNYINYNIYLQAACAVQNSMEEYYVIAFEEDGEYTFCKMPGRSKFVFGLYPSEIGWQSVTATENVIEDEGYGLMASQSEDIMRRTSERWNDLRKNALSTENLLQTAYLYEQRLANSGYIVREEEPSAYAGRCENLHDMIRERMDYLDSYYSNID